MQGYVDRTVSSFFSSYQARSFEKAELLIHAGEQPSGIYYIEEGLVKMYQISTNGEEMVATIFKPKSYFPMSWAINKTENHYFFEAMSSLSARLAPATDVLAFLEREPIVVMDLLGRVYSGLDGMTERMMHLMGGNAYGRIVNEIVILARRFGGARTNSKNTSARFNFSEKDIAAQTGLTRETVSREIKRLKDKGLVVLKKDGMLIPDTNLLEAENSDGV